MTAIVGRIQEFEPETEPFSAYWERLQLFFDANDIVEGKRVSVLLTVIGAKHYALLRDLLAPRVPKDVTLDDLVSTLKAHFEPKPLVIAERSTSTVVVRHPTNLSSTTLPLYASCLPVVSSARFWMKLCAIGSSAGSAARACKRGYYQKKSSPLTRHWLLRKPWNPQSEMLKNSRDPPRQF